MRKVCASSWSLKPGILRLSLWTPDFNPMVQKLQHSQCFKITGLPQEYWCPSIIFTIAGGIGSPIVLDEATTNRSFGHFARVLVEINVGETVPDQVLVERDGFEFFVSIEVENMPSFCSVCQTIGHEVSNCRRNHKKEVRVEESLPLSTENIEAEPKQKEFNLVVDLDLGSNKKANIEGLERLILEDSLSEKSNDVENLEVRDNSAVKAVHNVVPTDVNCFITEVLDNPTAARDMAIVGRFWSEDKEDEPVEEFTEVLSKFQKKKMKQKQEGFGNSKSRLVLKNFCLANKPDLVFIAEPMIDFDDVSPLFWSGLKLKSFGNNERGVLKPNLWGLCDIELNPHVIATSNQHITSALEVDNKVVFISVVYAHNCYVQRRELWADIQSLMDRNCGSWCCIRDFNVVLGAHECRGPNLPPRLPSDEFKLFTDANSLIHLETRGTDFTWTNRRRGQAETEKRLDRSLSQKLRMLKKELKSWNTHVFGNIHDRVKNALANVEAIQAVINSKDKAKIKWQTDGDRNTRFFHKVTKIRQASKSLSSLRDGDNILVNQNEIAQHVLNYFMEVYASPNDVRSNHLIQAVIPSLGNLSPIVGPKGVRTPSHVLYDDDILIFCKGIKSNLVALNSLIKDYAEASARRTATLTGILGFSAGSSPFNYLGVPLFRGKPKRLHLQPIADRILAKLATWKGLVLSIMGRVELVKSVVHSMLAYSFHIYLWGWLAGILNTYIDTSSIESVFSVCNDQWSSQVKNVVTTAIIHTINTVWFCKNSERFENKAISFLQAISRIKAATSLSGNSSKLMTNNSVSNFVILRQISVKQNFQRAPRIKEVIWLAPLYGWIKINSDGATQGAPGLADGGGIFRDYQGAYVGGFAVFFGISNSLFVELKAAIMAIEIAYHKGWRNIWLECDSALVVSIFNGKGKVPWKLENLWRRCLWWLSSMCFKVSHLYREGNACADKLASFGVSSKVYTWWDVTPWFIFEEFNTNRLGLPNYRCNYL
ncbi:hypothetical protein Lal_00018817 [Lupinus albus]|nr:hypothetical protein Lal_00018817 [Lupinus albus]